MIRVAVSEVAACASRATVAPAVAGPLAPEIAKAAGVVCRACACVARASQAPTAASAPALGAAAREDAARMVAVCAIPATLVRTVG
jgi:hypothetical protein